MNVTAGGVKAPSFLGESKLDLSIRNGAYVNAEIRVFSC
jgi:hypothetical protein